MIEYYELQAASIGMKDYFKCCNIPTNADIKTLKLKWFWGTCGLSRQENPVWKRLIDLETSHLYNILKTESWYLPNILIHVIHSIISDRKNNIFDGYPIRENNYVRYRFHKS